MDNEVKLKIINNIKPIIQCVQICYVFYEKAFCTAARLLSQSRKPPGPEF